MAGDWGAKHRDSSLFLIRTTLSGRHNALVNNLEALDSGCSHIESFYQEYDVNRITQANGYRSFCKVIGILMDNVCQVCRQNLDSKSSRRLIHDWFLISNLLLKCLQVARLIRQKGKTYSLTSSSDLDRKILSRGFHLKAEEIAPLFGRVGFFFLEKEFQQEWYSLVSATHLMGCPSSWHKMRYISSKWFATAT